MGKDEQPEEDGQERRRAIGLFLSGESFFQTANHTCRAIEAKELKLCFHMPIYYLYSHSLELTLKAFLSAHGLSERALKKLGHDLDALWTKCRQLGPELPAPDLPFVGEVVDWLSPYATEYEFRYLKPGFKELPILADVEKAISQLMAAVKPHCEARMGGAVPGPA